MNLNILSKCTLSFLAQVN